MVGPDAVKHDIFDEFDEADELPSGSDPAISNELITLEGLSLKDQVVREFADYRNVVFTRDVVLRDVRFVKGFSFAGARFLGRVILNDVRIDNAKGCIAAFSGAVFSQQFKASRDCRLYRADFSGAIFQGNAIFKGVTFLASARFEGTTFNACNFSRATFSGVGVFNDAKFQSSADFEAATFKYNISAARFRHAKFTGPAIFKNARFAGDAEFDSAVFNSGATFFQAQFALERAGSEEEDGEELSAEPSKASADLIVSFSGAVFLADDDGDTVTFEGAKFGDRNFKRATTFDNAYFRPMKGQKPKQCIANFREVSCLGPITFRGAQFQVFVRADFGHSRFEDNLDLGDCKFLSDAIFEKCAFRDDIVLAQTQFSHFPDFRQATFNHYPNLSQAALSELDKPWRGEERKVMVQRLSTLRRLANRVDDKRMEFALLVRELKIEGGIASRLYGIFSSYGQSWARPAGWLIFLTVVAFPLAYLANNGFIPTTQEEAFGFIAGQKQVCSDAKNGTVTAAALELSVRNALIVAAENDVRSERITNCLASNDNAWRYSGLMMTLLEALQTIATLVLVFFIGAAIRRRLQMR